MAAATASLACRATRAEVRAGVLVTTGSSFSLDGAEVFQVRRERPVRFEIACGAAECTNLARMTCGVLRDRDRVGNATQKCAMPPARTRRLLLEHHLDGGLVFHVGDLGLAARAHRWAGRGVWLFARQRLSNGTRLGRAQNFSGFIQRHQLPSHIQHLISPHASLARDPRPTGAPVAVASAHNRAWMRHPRLWAGRRGHGRRRSRFARAARAGTLSTARRLGARAGDSAPA
jgi:hypothetical protein